MVLTLIILNPRSYNRRDLNKKKLDSENFNIFNIDGSNLRGGGGGGGGDTESP